MFRAAMLRALQRYVWLATHLYVWVFRIIRRSKVVGGKRSETCHLGFGNILFPQGAGFRRVSGCQIGPRVQLGAARFFWGEPDLGLGGGDRMACR